MAATKVKDSAGRALSAFSIQLLNQDREHAFDLGDRMLFRGYLQIMSGWQMAQFFNSSGIRYRELKTFLLEHAERVKRYAINIAEQEGRPYEYLQEKIKKEDLAKETAERDHIEEGLICIFSVLEPCRTFPISDWCMSTAAPGCALT